MRAEDLRGLELISQDAKTGFPIIGSYRMLTLGLSGLARLHQDLIDCLGWEKMQVLLKRFGYENGLSHASVIAELYDFDDTRQWFKAGSVIRRLAGLIDEELTEIDLAPEQNKIRFKGIWRESFEAATWMSLFGRSESPVCCILEGLVSGYASAVLGQEVMVRETACQAQGGDYCTFEGRSLAEWGLSPEDFRRQLQVADVQNELEQLKKELEYANRFIASQKQEIRDLRQHVYSPGSRQLVFRSRALEKAVALAEKVAPTGASVLIQGESGTGKEVLARMIHDQSGRNQAPFQAINCAALPSNLLESELFGHVRGAFTGAETDKTGLFVEAGRGTIFLDEIGSLSLELQAKLLRVIQEKNVRPVGGSRSQPVEARIISATNQDLKKMSASGQFREDLYFRLAVFPIDLPPLRERREDILPLARHFLDKARPGHRGFSPEAVHMLESHEWQGNIRELENWIEYAVILAGDAERIRPEHFPGRTPDAADDPARLLGRDLPTCQELERRYIDHVLQQTGGSRKKAAEILGISISTLWRRLNTRP